MGHGASTSKGYEISRSSRIDAKQRRLSDKIVNTKRPFFITRKSQKMILSLVETTELNTILSNRELCAYLVKYLEYEFEKNAGHVLRPTCNYAKTALMVWVEINDYLKSSKGSFRRMYSRYLHEKYITEESQTLAPLMTDTLDDLRYKFSNCGNTGVEPSRLIGAKEDCFEFLERGGFYRFIHSKQASGYAAILQNIQMIDSGEKKLCQNVKTLAPKYTLGIVSSQIQIFRSKRDAPVATSTSLMPNTSGSVINIFNVVDNPSFLRQLKAYLVSLDLGRFIQFHERAVEFECIFELLQQGGAGFEIASTGDLFCAPTHRYYEFLLTIAFNRYIVFIATGSDREIGFDASLVNDIRKKLGKPKLYSHLFRNCIFALRSHIEQNLFTGFMKTTFYSTMLQLTAYMNAIPRRGSARRTSISSVTSAYTEKSTKDTDKLTSFEMTTAPVPLPIVVTTRCMKYFFGYLSNRGMANEFSLLSEIQNYRTIPPNQDSFLRSSAQKIFDKYFSGDRGLLVEVPISIKRMVSQDLSNAARPDTFDDLDLHITELIAYGYYPQYISDTSYICLLASHYASVQYGSINLPELEVDFIQSLIHSMDPSLLRTEGDEYSFMEKLPEAIINMVEALYFKELQFYFRRFLHHSMPHKENILHLWVLLEEYRHMLDEVRRRGLSKRIYHTFIEPHSREEVTIISQSLKLQMEKEYRKEGIKDFVQVQLVVFIYLCNCIYPHFAKSTDCQAMFVERHRVSRILQNGEGDNFQIGTGQPIRASRTKTPERIYSDMVKLLNHPKGLMEFESYCSGHQMYPTLKLWIELEDLLTIHGDFYLHRRFKKMYKRYHPIESIPWNELPADHLQAITDAVDTGLRVRVVLFNLRTDIENILHTTFAPFLKSTHFKNFIKTLRPQFSPIKAPSIMKMAKRLLRGSRHVSIIPRTNPLNIPE